MLHDRFYARWDEPTGLEREEAISTVLLEIQISRDGRITSARLAKSSGNLVMDDSVMAAARRVLQVDPLPQGLGDRSGYKVNIEFQLHPGG